ncbi:MAG TPA: tetratricopeptide repeat protein [Methanocella sp.]|uniref:tetratricopeptide repeat protein n=1 Tax=Methanocella sp. TaxID=2052833 RepID=UPI002BD22FBC|nr:tetratricopeptide repeat protein [Methanocella sp.]HTY91792.1 tetratricopeptide repeat protein [Methanocella sp.]
MAPQRRMTRQVQIGLSHSEKAKRLSSTGFYEEALKELNIALRAFETENRDGLWDDAIAGVLNNAGFVYIFMGNYQGAEDTFRSAIGLKERLGDKKSLAATLAGLADAYRGQCRFDDAASALQEALDAAVAIKDDSMAKTLTASLDALERTRCDMPDANYKKADFDELYVPKAGADVSARLAYVKIKVKAPDELTVEADIGFPYQMQDLEDAEAPHFPAIVLLFPKGVESVLEGSGVTDEEENPVSFNASAFDGLLYGPGSYCRGGPQPLPLCKQYLYTFGAGHVLGWHIGANGWYHVEASLRVNLDAGLRLYICMPFGSVKLRSAAVAIDRPSAWGAVLLTAGNFLQGRSLETAKLPHVPHKSLYEGPAKAKIKSEAGTTMKYGVLCLEMIK